MGFPIYSEYFEFVIFFIAVFNITVLGFSIIARWNLHRYTVGREFSTTVSISAGDSARLKKFDRLLFRRILPVVIVAVNLLYIIASYAYESTHLSLFQTAASGLTFTNIEAQHVILSYSRMLGGSVMLVGALAYVIFVFLVVAQNTMHLYKVPLKKRS